MFGLSISKFVNSYVAKFYDLMPFLISTNMVMRTSFYTEILSLHNCQPRLKSDSPAHDMETISCPPPPPPTPPRRKHQMFCLNKLTSRKMHSIFITADNIQPTSKMSYEKFKIFTMISYLHFTADSNFPLIMLAADATKNIADNAYYICVIIYNLLQITKIYIFQPLKHHF